MFSTAKTFFDVLAWGVISGDENPNFLIQLGSGSATEFTREKLGIDHFMKKVPVVGVTSLVRVGRPKMKLVKEKV